MPSNYLTSFGEIRTGELAPVAGWTFAYNVNPDIVTSTLTGSGSITAADNMAVLSTTAATSSTARIKTTRVLRYIPGVGGLVRFTGIFTTPVAGSRQMIGLGTSDNAFAIGYKDTDWGVFRINDGTENFTANLNRAALPIDPTNGNVYEIAYQWLGFGQIRFFSENSQSGEFDVLHTIDYANTAVVPSIQNPTLPLFAYVENTTNDSAIVVKTASGMTFREGMYNPNEDPLEFTRGFTASKSVTTEVPVLSLRTATTYQSLDNQIRARLRSLSVAADGGLSVTFRVYVGGDLTDASFADLDTDRSSLQYDTAATALTGGKLVDGWVVSKTGSTYADVASHRIEAEPGTALTITAASGATNAVNVFATMGEKF